MAMEIIVSADVHDFGLPEANSSVIPPPPPLPASFRVGKLHADPEVQSLSDSGHGDSMLHICGAMPGLDLSDSEFNEEFTSDSSAATSRRGSAGSIPQPPPPPPLPGYITGITSIPPPPPLPSYLQGLPVQSLITSLSEPQMRLRRTYSYDSYDSYDSYLSDFEIEARLREEEANKGEKITQTCIVCYDELSDFTSSVRKCCKEYVCRSCLSAIVHTNIDEGNVFITCPNPSCDKGAFGKDEISSFISGPTKDKFDRLRAEAEGSYSKRACPNCTHLTEHQVPRRFRRYREEDVQITCTRCQYIWCFSCHAPWHNGVTCKQFRKGNVQFKKWTHETSRTGVANCQKCPLCRVYIQRSTGCDHMTCNRCDTHFCYKCGERFLDIPGIGDHYDQTSILGCKYNYCKNNPTKRRAIRGGYFGAKLASLTGYPVLFVGGVVVIVVVGAVALPIYGGYRYYKYRKNMKKRYWRRRRH